MDNCECVLDMSLHSIRAAADQDKKIGCRSGKWLTTKKAIMSVWKNSSFIPLSEKQAEYFQRHQIKESLWQTDQTKLAMKICVLAHANQIDKAGVTYINHPIYVAEHIGTDPDYICAALLHDVAEDTEITLEDLKVLDSFPSQVLTALSLLTHDKSVDYFEYLKPIKENKIARTVKIIDLLHNSNLSRLKSVSPEDSLRVVKYQKALDFLQS